MGVNLYKYIFYPLIFLLNQTNEFSTPLYFHPPNQTPWEKTNVIFSNSFCFLFSKTCFWEYKKNK